MPRLLSSLLTLRRDPRILKLPPYLSALCVIVGVSWLFLLPLDHYSRKTYISENALLPGQVHTYFGGSDHDVLRAYRHEITALAPLDNYIINDKLADLLKGIGLKVGRQNYTYSSAGGGTYAGDNVYGILQAPRGDATEAIVLVAAWETIDGQLNLNGLSLALALARYFKRWSLWSKDIIFLFPPDSKTGTQAWVDAYHDRHDPSRVSALPRKSGLLQGALALDFAGVHKFESVHIIYDGVNGQLPNLDLINSIINIAGGQMDMSPVIQNMYQHSGKYWDTLQTMLRGMLNQGIGHAAGPHSSFIPYHVDAVTLQPYGQGWHDEMAMGRLVEGTFRSLNNLLEHLHQSFFFYLLMKKDRFVSIGTYLPSAMLLAANFSIMAMSLWFRSGHVTPLSQPVKQLGHVALAKTTTRPEKGVSDATKDQSGNLPRSSANMAERALFLPLAVVALSLFLGAIPLYVLNHTPESLLYPMYSVFSIVTCLLPHVGSYILTTFFEPSLQQYQLIKCFSLLLFGIFLATLATLNFSLAFLVGLLATPLSFTNPSRGSGSISTTTRHAFSGFLVLLAPTSVLYSVCALGDVSVGVVLKEAVFGWDVWGMYTPLIFWCVWWPAWLVGSVIVLGQPAAATTRRR